MRRQNSARRVGNVSFQSSEDELATPANPVDQIATKLDLEGLEASFRDFMGRCANISSDMFESSLM